MKPLRNAQTRAKPAALTALLASVIVLTNAMAQDPPKQLQPFLAGYSITIKGVNAGTSELELKTQTNGQWIYSSKSAARGLFRMFFHDEILQTSTLEVTDTGIRPIVYKGDDGSDDTDRDINYDFDWKAKQVTGVAENQPVKMALTDNVHDPMSIQLALVLDLLRGKKVTGYRLANKQEIKDYEYTYKGKERLKTAVGEYDTVIYSSQRAGSKRSTVTWHAPALGYIPLKAERLKDGKREAVMEIRTLQRGQ